MKISDSAPFSLYGCSYLFTFLLSSQFYWHVRLKSTAYFIDPPCKLLWRRACSAKQSAYRTLPNPAINKLQRAADMWKARGRWLESCTRCMPGWDGLTRRVTYICTQWNRLLSLEDDDANRRPTSNHSWNESPIACRPYSIRRKKDSARRGAARNFVHLVQIRVSGDENQWDL